MMDVVDELEEIRKRIVAIECGWPQEGAFIDLDVSTELSKAIDHIRHAQAFIVLSIRMRGRKQ